MQTITLLVATHLHEGLVEVTQQQTQFAVKIGSLVLLGHELVYPATLVRIGLGVIFFQFCQFGSLLYGIVKTAELVDELYLQSFGSEPDATLGDRVHICTFHLAAIGNNVEEVDVATIYKSLHTLDGISILLPLLEYEILFEMCVFVGLYTVKSEAEFVGNQALEVRDKTENADAAGNGGGFSEDIIGA